MRRQTSERKTHRLKLKKTKRQDQKVERKQEIKATYLDDLV